jgi:hypothetical protein
MLNDLHRFAAHLRETIRLQSPGATALTDAQFNELALELFRLQFARNGVLRRTCEVRGMGPQTVEHWSQIPTMPAAAFKEFELTCLPVSARTTFFQSSGTTSTQRSRHFHCAESLSLYEASMWAGFVAHVLAGLAPTVGGWQLLALTPPLAGVPHSSLVHMFETIRQRVGASPAMFCGAVAADGGWLLDIQRVIDTLQAAVIGARPVVLLGTAFSFVHLLDALTARALKLVLPPGSRVMETGGYKGRSRELPKAALHALITQRLGVPRSHIVCEYGMSELSSQAYDGVAGATADDQPAAPRAFAFPAWTRVRVVSPETGGDVAPGESGLVRIFDLANVYSVLALQTEDLAIRRAAGFELVGRTVAAEPRGCSLMPADARQITTNLREP